MRDDWGSIRRKASGLWLIRYTVAGKRESETVRGSRSDAERRRAELRVMYEGTTTAMTVGQFWRKHYLDYLESELAPSTASGYRRYFAHDIEPTFGDVLLTKVTPMMVQAWLSDMTHGTAKHAKAVLSSILERARTLGLLTDNVAQRRYILPKTRAKGQRSRAKFSASDLERIAEECRGEDWEAAFIWAAFGGATREEALSPHPEEVVELDGFAAFLVVRGVQRFDGAVRVVERPKNDYREDWVVVPPPHSQRVLELKEEALARGDVWLTDDGFGNPVDPNNMATAYKRWFLGRTLPYVPFSNLRNSYSTNMHASDVPDTMVHKLMRHSGPEIDYKHYDRPSLEEKVAALKKAGF